MANPRNFVIDPVLTAIVIGYSNPATALIADRVLPRIPTASSFKYTVFDHTDDFTVPNGEIGRRGRTPRVEFKAEELDSSVKDYGWEGSVPQTDIDDAAARQRAGTNNYDPRARVTNGLANIKGIAREKRVADLVHNANSYDATRQIQLSGTDQLSDYEHSDPIGIINHGLNSTLIARPNVAVMSKYGWSLVRGHPRLVKAVKGGLSGDGMISREQFVDLFELQALLVGEGQINTAAKGQDLSLAEMWGKHIALLHLNPQGGPGGDMPTFGFTADCGGPVAMTYQEEQVGLLGGEVIRVGERVREHISAKPVGYFIEDAFG